jgi:hypothetical protein
MREQTLSALPRLAVNAAPNGGVTVKGWSKNEILVRARVEAWGDTNDEARKRMGEVKILTDGGNVRSTGPRSALGRQEWSVSYEVFTPQRIDLALESVNGGVGASDVHGDIHVSTTNGGLHLARLGGKVTGGTTNGGVHIELAGDRWDGDGFDLSTTNGGVHIEVPENYSAHLQAHTTNGGMHSDIPVTVQGRWINKSLDATLGSGGALLKVSTTNGGVHINRKS